MRLLFICTHNRCAASFEAIAFNVLALSKRRRSAPVEAVHPLTFAISKSAATTADLRSQSGTTSKFLPRPSGHRLYTAGEICPLWMGEVENITGVCPIRPSRG